MLNSKRPGKIGPLKPPKGKKNNCFPKNNHFQGRQNIKMLVSRRVCECPPVIVSSAVQIKLSCCGFNGYTVSVLLMMTIENRRISWTHVIRIPYGFRRLHQYGLYHIFTWPGQISIIPKPEFFGDFGEIPLQSPQFKVTKPAGKGRYKLLKPDWVFAVTQGWEIRYNYLDVPGSW